MQEYNLDAKGGGAGFGRRYFEKLCQLQHYESPFGGLNCMLLELMGEVCVEIIKNLQELGAT